MVRGGYWCCASPDFPALDYHGHEVKKQQFLKTPPGWEVRMK